jgi:hypothetical protein
MGELADLRRFRSTVADPDGVSIASARGALERSIARGTRRRAPTRRAALAVALVLLAVGGSGLAIADRGIFDGPPAPPAQDAGQQRLIPSLKIGHATTLASYGGRSLFGSRTAAGGYCLSASSPTDPDAEGGRCLSDRYGAVLAAGKPITIPISGGSVGGYAPGASTVSLTGLGDAETVPVAPNGWWIGVATLGDLFALPARERNGGEVTATLRAADGSILDTLVVFRLESIPGVPGVLALKDNDSATLSAGPSAPGPGHSELSDPDPTGTTG